MRAKFLRLLPAILLAACAPARFVVPIPEGHYAAAGSLGGPLITLGDLVFPMPLTSLAVGYGLEHNISVFGGLHTTALAFGDLQLDLGALDALIEQDGLRPGVTASPVANIVLGFRDGSFKLWPELDFHFFWHYIPTSNFVYIGISNWFELAATRGNGEPQTRHWIPNLELGHVFDGENYQYAIEAKYLALGIQNEPNAVTYHGISGNGGFGIYLALTRKF